MRVLLDGIARRQPEMLARLQEWSAINSGSLNIEGVQRMREALAEAFAPLGGAAEMIAVPPLTSVDGRGEVIHQPLGEALRIRKRPNAKRQVLLMGHTDTVFPLDSPFQQARMLEDGTLNGPGVADLKGGLVCMLAALTALEESGETELGWEVLLNPDEEIGSQSSLFLMREAAARCDFGLIYEPALADGTLAGARKGSGNFVLVVQGKSAHAGRDFAAGRNAIALLAEATGWLFALNGTREGVTLNPGKVEGGGPVNIVPDVAILRFNVRMEKVEDQAWLQAQFDAVLEKLRAREGFSASLHGSFTRPPKVLSAANEQLFNELKQTGAAAGSTYFLAGDGRLLRWQ